MEHIFSSLYANFLTDWQIKNLPYKTALIKVSSLSFCLLIALFVIHYHNFPKLTQDMIFADLNISFMAWLALLILSYFSLKIWQILKQDLENPQ